MTRKSAALLAFLATLLAAIYLTWEFIVHLLNVMRGVEALMALLPSFIYAFVTLAALAFFFVFYRSEP